MSGAKKAVPSGLYNVPEAAARLGITAAQAYTLDNAGNFPVPVLVVGATRKVRVAELEEFLQGSASTPSPGCPVAEDVVADTIKRLAEAARVLADAAHALATVKS